MRCRVGNWIYFVEFRRDKIYNRETVLTKREYQKDWCRKKNELKL